MSTDLRMAAMPSIESSDAERALLGLGMHRLAAALHEHRNHATQRDSVGGLMLVATSAHGSFSDTSEQFIVASNVFIPDRVGVDALMAPEFVTNSIDLARKFVATRPERIDIYGVWSARDVRSSHSSAMLYVGNGHYGSITWSESGSRSPAIGSMPMAPSPALRRIDIPNVELNDVAAIDKLSDIQRLAVLYRSLDKRLRAH